MFRGNEPNVPQQLFISFFQCTGQFIDQCMFVGCDLFDLQPQLFNLRNKASHFPAPPAFPIEPMQRGT